MSLIYYKKAKILTKNLPNALFPGEGLHRGTDVFMVVLVVLTFDYPDHSFRPDHTHLISSLAYQLIAVGQDKSLSPHPAGQFRKR